MCACEEYLPLLDPAAEPLLTRVAYAGRTVNRLRLISILLHGDRSVRELRELLGLTAWDLSRELSILRV